MKLIVTIDVEEDAGPGWASPPIPAFLGVTEGIKNRLQPLFRDFGISPTLMISPIVLQDIASVDVLGRLDKAELATHLHWEQICPHAERSLSGGIELLKHMQFDFPARGRARQARSADGIIPSAVRLLPDGLPRRALWRQPFDGRHYKTVGI